MYTPEELLPVMIKLAEKFTSKDSSSISYERAEYLMDAVIYCISEVDPGLVFDNLNTNVHTSLYSGNKDIMHNITVKDSSLYPQEAYDLGLTIVKEKVADLTNHFNELIKHFDAYGNENYYDTVAKGIPGFLLRYDPQFAPQENIITMDYPVLLPAANLRGVNAIIHYVNCIEIEQTFLSHFQREAVVRILDEYHPDYTHLFDNMAEIVFHNVLTQLIPDDNLIQDHSETEIIDSLKKMWHQFVKQYYEDNSDLEEYFLSSIRDYSYRIKTKVN